MWRRYRILGCSVLLAASVVLGAVLLGHPGSVSPGSLDWGNLLGWAACGLAICLGGWFGWRLQQMNGVLHVTIQRLCAQGVDHDVVPTIAAINNLSQWIQQSIDQCVKTIRGLQSEVEDLQIQTQLSLHQKENVEAIIYSLRDPVVVVDDNYRLLLANRAAGQLLGFNWKLVREEALSDIVGPDAQSLIAVLRRGRKNNTDASRHQLSIGPAHDARTFDCVVSAVRHDIQSGRSMVAVLHDVTREKEVSEVKNDFVSYVSHELKTPLASITAYTEMLLDGEADNEDMRLEFYGVIQGQAKRLNRLIEDILNVSRIESGLMKIEKGPVSLALLVEEQLQMIRSYAEDRKIQVISQKPIVFDQVFADRDMMSQVIINLLSNAIKYNCPGGSVTIETEVDEVQAVARVSVKDTGVGIPAEDVEHVFDKFYRARANENRAEGTGLGLNLVKQIVEKLHHGRVFVRSQVGAGSTFGFELALATRQDMEQH